MNNLIAPLRIYADLLEGGRLDPSEQHRIGQAIHHGVDRLQLLCQMLTELDAPDHVPQGDVALDVLLERLGHELACRQGVQVSLSLAPDCVRVLGDTEQLGRALRLVCDNSVQALGANGGAIALRARLGGADPARAIIDIVDDGRGIDPTLLPRVCEPFVTTKPPSVGFGLGLAVASAIVDRHGGSLCLRSAPGTGTTVTIELPIVD